MELSGPYERCQVGIFSPLSAACRREGAGSKGDKYNRKIVEENNVIEPGSVPTVECPQSNAHR